MTKRNFCDILTLEKADNMKLFELAKLELVREGKDPNNAGEVAERALKIIAWMKKHGKHAIAIMQGAAVYQYGNNIKTYARA